MIRHKFTPTQRRKGAEVTKLKLHDIVPFRALMTQQQNCVMERLQCGGELRTTAEDANELEWLHTLHDCLERVSYNARFDLSDPTVARALRRHLAVTAAACEMWADQLEAVE